MNTSTALIIGGGIAGPVTAMALQRIGVEATVYEAYDVSADGIGGAMSIAPNGLNALKIIGVDDVVEQAGVPTSRMIMQSGPKWLGEIGGLAGVRTPHTIARGDLYLALVAEALRRGIKVEHGKRLVSAVDDGSGVTVGFSDGTSARADILVGADGIRSTVRQLIDPASPQPRYTGLLGFGGWVSDSGLPSTNGAMHFVFGRKAFFGYQIEDDGRAMWFGNLPRRESMTAAQARAIPDEVWLRELTELYAQDGTPAVHILSRVKPGELINTGALEDLPTVKTWHKGRIVLVGDSAHATSPSSGQGASLAAESAIELARCLRDLSDVEGAFTAYEKLRRERCEKIIAGAAKVNNDKAAGPIGRVLRDLMFPIAMKTFFHPEKTFGFMHRHTIDWESNVTTT